MYKRNISVPAYHSKENFMLYNFNVTLSFVSQTIKKLQWFKYKSVLFLIPYNSEKNKSSNFKRK